MIFFSGPAYCPDCRLKWAAVSYTPVALECPKCHQFIGHLLDLDATGLVKQVTIDVSNIIEFPIGGKNHA